MLKAISHLEPDQAIDTLSNASRLVFPISPSQNDSASSPVEFEALGEAGKQARLKASKLSAIQSQNFLELSRTDIQKLLSVITDNISALVLSGEDKSEILKRVKRENKQAFASSSAASIWAILSYSKITMAALCTVLVSALLYGLAERSMMQKETAAKDLEISSLNSQLSKASKGEHDLALEELSEKNEEQVSSLENEVSMLQTELKRANALNSNESKPVASFTGCEGVSMALGSDGMLRWKIAHLEAGKALHFEIKGKRRDGSGAIMTQNFTYQIELTQFAEEYLQPLTSITSVKANGLPCHLEEQEAITK